MLVTSIKDNIQELIELLDQLEEVQFSEPQEILSGSSIGGHYRHIIEFFTCLLDGYQIGSINYDNRNRDIDLQTKPAMALEKLQYIFNTIAKKNKEITLEQVLEHKILQIESNYYRELLYNLEHSIHHQALIKIGVLNYKSVRVSKNFGVASSTITYREKCVQ